MPADIFEDVLISTFQKYGTLYEVILYMNPSTGEHSGVAVITYVTPSAAEDVFSSAKSFKTDAFHEMQLCRMEKRKLFYNELVFIRYEFVCYSFLFLCSGTSRTIERRS